MYLDNKYTKWYNSIIETAKSRINNIDEYMENRWPYAGLDRLIYFTNCEGAIFQDIQQVVLYIRFRLVDLVQQQHHLLLRSERSPDWAPDNVIIEIVYLPPSVATSKPRVVQQLVS